jgi:hypothetical protein
MPWPGLFVGIFLVAQVPPPTLGDGGPGPLEKAWRAIVVKERTQQLELSGRLAAEGDAAGSKRVREQVAEAGDLDGPTRFVPLPEVARSRPPVRNRDAAGARLDEIEARTALEFFILARQAAQADPPSYSLASKCLRAVLERDPDHAEARRLLGYVPHDGGWARPYAVQKLKKGNVSHPIFGWVSADWVPHLERGELPAPAPKGQEKVRWLAAADADQMRANWSPPWFIYTEHFEIQTNVTLAEAISFGRRLEVFHDLFTALFADILGENIPLVRRFKDRALAGEVGYRPHSVFYFGSKAEYVEYLSPRQGPKIAETLGFYDPPKSGGNRRMRAYFFRDPGGQLPVTATLYHEVSHQLLFETAGPNAYTRNAGNYWVFEGLGTYFETIAQRPDGSVEVGGMVGRRIEEALRKLVGQGQLIPLAEFVAYDQSEFNNEDRIHLHYQQAMVLAVFLMQWHDGVYREPFLDYIRDAYRGRIKHGAGRSLQDRLGQPYAVLDAQLKAFLTAAEGRLHGQEGQAATAAPRTVPEDAIRTVPRQ